MNLSSLITTLLAFFKHVFTETETLVVKFGTPMLASIEKNGGQVLVQAATDAVVAAETAGGTGEVKAAAALAAVSADLLSKGVPVVVNAAKGAIELAVADLQAKVTALPAAPFPAQPIAPTAAS